MKSLKVIKVSIKDIKPMHIGCGDCTACCTVFEIEEIKKPDRTPCPNLLKGSKCGCSIYETRPKMCQDFMCLWVQNLLFAGKEQYRPDRLGIVVTTMETPPFTGVMGVFAVNHKKRLPPQALSFLYKIGKTTLYFHDEKLNGPQHLIDEWKVKWGITADERI